MERITARMPKPLISEIQRRCEIQEMTVSDFVRTCVLRELFKIEPIR